MVVFIDDILIYSKTPEDHEGYLKVVLQILRDEHLYAKLEKCQFLLDEVNLLGHTISSRVVAFDSSKFVAVFVTTRLIAMISLTIKCDISIFK